MRKRDTEQDIDYVNVDSDDIDINVVTSVGILGDRLENIKIRSDRDHPSSQFNRKSRRHLEILDFPDCFVVLIVRMAASTFATSISIEPIKQDATGNLVWIIGILTASFLLSLWFYCARAIQAQPSLQWGALYLWFAILFGSILGSVF